MKKLPATPDLLRVAQRVVWFKRPDEALADPIHFLAHLMTYGTVEDLRTVRNVIGRNEYLEVLERVPAGIFDARSWTYWNLVMGRSPAPPMPSREALLSDA